MKFKKLRRKDYITIRVGTPNVPKGLLRKCKHCGCVVFSEEVKEKNYVCPKCGAYFRVHGKRRIEMIADKNSFVPWFEGMKTNNPLEMHNYEEKIEELQKKTGLDEAVITGEALIGGERIALAIMDGRFMMASMGEVVGKKIAKTVEKATKESLPVVIFCCSGGARMQEGIVSLMQMARTSAALKRHSDAGNLYISVLTDPTTGGVTASFAMLGDIILAEPNALIGFAGPRVIEQTIGQKLPKGFQRSEFLLEHGFIDKIVERKNLKKQLEKILKLHKKDIYIEENKNKITDLSFATGNEKAPWDRVELSRKKNRPVAMDYIDNIVEDFIEFHGDRYFRDDQAIIGGIGKINGKPVTVIGQAKGRNTKENLMRNFGMPSPDGYRKALRLMKQAEKFNRPVICLVDTPGAFCGMEAEERGQGEAIARNLFELSNLKTPVISIVIGEGGSGGALAMAVADEVWMLENSVYSVLSPEGYATILWKNSKMAKEAAKVMKMTGEDLLQMGIVTKVFNEPDNFTIDNLSVVTNKIREALIDFISKAEKENMDDILNRRYEFFSRGE